MADDDYLGAEIGDRDYLLTRLKATEDLVTELLRRHPRTARRLQRDLEAPPLGSEPLAAGAVVAAKIGMLRRALDRRWRL